MTYREGLIHELAELGREYATADDDPLREELHAARIEQRLAVLCDVVGSGDAMTAFFHGYRSYWLDRLAGTQAIDTG